MLGKLTNIIHGWYLFLFGKRTKQAKKRIDICKKCEYRKGYFCSVCWCELHAKSTIEEEECPKGFWPSRMEWFQGGFIKPTK